MNRKFKDLDCKYAYIDGVCFGKGLDENKLYKDIGLYLTELSARGDIDEYTEVNRLIDKYGI